MSAEAASPQVVTGAFGYTGRYITRLLLAKGERVTTLTGHPDRSNPFGGRVGVTSFDFDAPDRLAQSLSGATTLYNTYWVRFPRGDVTFERAVENSRVLIKAAKAAGVRRIVHLSITNPSEDSSLPYFRGKALVEKAVIESGLSYAIVRPTVIFGREDILINNIAWLLRRFPVFVIAGSGEYRLQPIHVEDVARIAVAAGHERNNVTIDAAGPECYTFNELVSLIGGLVRSRARIIHLDPAKAVLMARVIGLFLGDIVVTGDELEGLMASLLVSEGGPTGETGLSDWLGANANSLGIKYASELSRHYR